jgi:membrane protease YdiL (CAAX protease family)
MHAGGAGRRTLRGFGMRASLLRPAGIVIAGTVFFVAAVLLVTGLAFFNAARSPAVPWFPLVALPVLFAVVWQLDRRWDIGLRVPPGTRWHLLAAFAVTSMVASHCVLVLEGAAHGLTRSFEGPPPGVTPFFAEVYWVAVVVGMSTASEVAFRGILQSRLTPLLGFWPGLLVPLVVNTLSHRWDGLAERTVGVVCILFAWGWLRHLAGSLTPTILTHVAAIFAWDALLRAVGPWDQAAMGPGALALTAATGLSALAASVWIARELRAPAAPSAAYPAQA